MKWVPEQIRDLTLYEFDVYAAYVDEMKKRGDDV